jgi:hypothetical protein
MKKRKEPVGDRAPDRGAALLLVLVIVTVIFLAGAALLTFSDTSIRTTVALRDQAGNAYNADGAAQVAIDSLSTGYGFTSPALFENANNTTCFGPNTTSGTLNLPDFYPAANGQNANVPSSASVVCTANPATGVNGTIVPINGKNRPGQAILTLGRINGEDGINVKNLSSTQPFSVKGTVKSNSNINVVSGTLQSTTAVTAFGPCSGSIVSVPAQNCNTNTNLADPNYDFEPHFPTPPDPADVVPTYQAVPASCSGGVVKFQPGYYDDAKALTDLMTGNGTCKDSTWWFTPGTYYFDFHNNTDDGDVYLGSGNSRGGSSADQWAITRGTLVAGTPVDSNGTPLTSPGSSPAVPGSCQNPIKSVGAKGVQFIFGGDSQLALGGSANGEICGTYSATRPPIGVFGLKSGAATTKTLTGSALQLSIAGNPPSPPRFVIAPTRTSATWAKTSSSSDSSTITVSGYAPPSAIPAGSIVKSATIRFRHGSSIGYTTTGPANSRDSLALTFTPTGGTAISVAPSLPSTAGLTVENLPIDASGSSTFARFVHDNGFTGADMAYTATLKNQRTETFDNISVDIQYVAPAFRSENIRMDRNSTSDQNCMTQGYTGSTSGGCPVLSTGVLPNFSGAFYVQGTTYTPIAAIDLTLNLATQQVLRFGVISRSLWIKEMGSFSYTGPVIEVPDTTTGGNSAPVVFLTVYVCPATTPPSCSTNPGAIKALRVKAMMRDPTAPLSKMTILSWSNLR